MRVSFSPFSAPISTAISAKASEDVVRAMAHSDTVAPRVSRLASTSQVSLVPKTSHKSMGLVVLLLLAVAAAQFNAPYSPGMRDLDNQIRREQRQVDDMSEPSPLRESRLWGLEQRRQEAAALAV